MVQFIGRTDRTHSKVGTDISKQTFKMYLRQKKIKKNIPKISFFIEKLSRSFWWDIF